MGAYLEPFALFFSFTPFFFPLPVPFPVSSNPSIFNFFFFPGLVSTVDMVHFWEFWVVEEVEMGGELSCLWPLQVVGALEHVFASIGDFDGVVKGLNGCWMGMDVEVRAWEWFG